VNDRERFRLRCFAAFAEELKGTREREKTVGGR
jgi:hypothetical protein